MWSGNVKTALSSLKMSKWRTIFTMMGIIIGVSSVVTVVSLGEGLKHRIVGQVNGLGSDVLTIRPGKVVNRAGGQTSLNLLSLLSVSTLTPNDVTNVSKLHSVKATVPINFITNSASGDDSQLENVFVAGTTPGMSSLLKQSINYGAFFPDEQENFAVVGPEIAQQMFHQLNPVGHSVMVNGQPFIIHGVLKPSAAGVLSVVQADFNYAIFIPYSQSLDLVNGRANILQILVRARSPDAVAQTTNDVNRTVRAAHGQQDFSVLKQDELLDITGGLVNTATGFISGIAAISLLVAGIGIMDIMLVSVSERTREIGIRKAVGATNRQIMNQFLIEGLALTIGGGLIGILISLAINTILRIYTSWEPVISLQIVLLAVCTSILVGIIFSVAPALKAARKDPITALRGD